MGFLFKLFIVGSAFSAVYLASLLQRNTPIPRLNEEWWAEGKPVIKDESIKPFEIHVSDEVLVDLKERLEKSTRLTAPLEGIGFQYGFNTEYLKKVKDYWLNTYDWRKQEAYLNTFQHYKTNIQGLDIHFIRSKPSKEVAKKKKVFPLLLLHGWPGSFVEFTKIIPLLTKESNQHDFVFEVIAPSLPGYGFSDAAKKPGMGTAEMGLVFDRLMNRLGFNRYFVQGGDWGSIIGTAMATLFPHRIIGLHVNMLASITPMGNIGLALGSLWPSLLMPADKTHLVYPLGSKLLHVLQETGYFHLQATKPDTIGVALSDSPIGLAAYILEKFSTWTKKENKALNDGGLSNEFTMDELLNNVMIYWTTNSITTAMRLYSEHLSARNIGYNLDNIVCVVPTGAVICPEELFIQPEALSKFKFSKLIRYNIMDKCGHFTAYEEPEMLAIDIKEFVSQIEKSST